MVVEPTPLPFPRLLSLTSAMAGVQICYAAQINQGTPQLLLLGLSPRLVPFAWLAGPLSGIIMQPIVGRLSDNCASSHGRRRPFLVGGAVLTSTALLLFSNAHLLPTKLAVAIVAFFLLDFSVQAVQGPLRALVTDVVPTQQRALANSCLAFFTGVGLLFGGLLTSVRLSKVLPFATDVQALFGLAALILMGTVAFCVLTTEEKSIERGRRYEELDENEIHEDGRSVSVALRNVPRPYWRVFLVQLCTWVGFFTLFVYVNAWVGTNVYLGDGGAEDGSEEREVFEAGVRLAGSANAVQAGLTVIYSMVLPWLLRVFGVRFVYFFSQTVEAACLLAAPLIRGGGGKVAPWLKGVVLLDISLFGIVWATTMGVPWTLVGNALQSDDWYGRRVGLFQTLFNASQSFPQLVVAAAIAPAVLWLSGDDPAWVMFVGGMSALMGAVLVVVLKVDLGDGGETGRIEGTEMFQLRGEDEEGHELDTF